MSLFLFNAQRLFLPYPPEFPKLVDEFIYLANRLAEGGNDGELSPAILFAAGRYNSVDFYVSEYRKAIVSNLEGVVGPVVKPQD